MIDSVTASSGKWKPGTYVMVRKNAPNNNVQAFRGRKGVVQPGPFKTITVVSFDGGRGKTFWNSNLRKVSD